ncbi:hypothetical protein KI387_012048 [Taxus chinensis]|uniref:BHLH domain-containing protein n=1 Tax=Taxus chinensis TaxID=29808 RepID=A0AA38CHL4_TAXCH|nr:hypothetical protein KI387_012048 [Taxus chinensis]
MKTMKNCSRHRILEKQRRSHMNMLCSTLRSCLPADKQEVKLTLPDVIQEASNFIGSLQKQIAELSSKRENIKDSPASKSAIDLGLCGQKMMELDRLQQEPLIPRIFVTNFGSTVTVEITSSLLTEQIVFSDIILFLEGEGLEIISASTFSRTHTDFYIFHLKGSNEKDLNVEILYEKLRHLISTNSSRAIQNKNHDADCSSISMDLYNTQECRQYSWEELFHMDNI